MGLLVRMKFLANYCIVDVRFCPNYFVIGVMFFSATYFLVKLWFVYVLSYAFYLSSFVVLLADLSYSLPLPSDIHPLITFILV